MNVVLDFARAALPWIAIGLFAAIMAVKASMSKADTESSAGKNLLHILTPVPAVVAFLLAILDFSDGKANSATTWMMIGIAMVVLGFVQKKENKDNHKE